MKKKSKIILGVCIVAAALIGMSVWNTWFSPTKIAFINFQTIQQGSISKANDNSSIKLSEVSLDNLDRLTGYDMVFINGMGLHIVEEQRQQIQQAADKGIPVYTSMATNPANNICNLDSVQQNLIRGYLTNGGKTNYRNMLNYIRKAIDGKISSIPEVEDPAERPSDMLYHAGLTNPDDELEFLTVADYEKFMKDNRLYKEGARKIMITGQMADATGLIEALEKEGYNVYPVQSMTKFMSFIDEVQPNAIINMAHGRMGDKMVDYLKAKNILLFAPLTINSLVDEWEKDPMGMAGGFMSQSIVTPEIDGAIRPFALFAQYEDEEGLRHSYAVPERLKTFVSTINNYLNLNTKPNSEKKVAIYYYKGPGQNALTAAGMEVVPSLYNLLVRMKQEGYNISGLPANAEELGKMIQAQGAVFNSYAEGAFNDFMQKGHPELITKDQYESWVKESLRPEKYQEVVDAFGEFPGNYMATNPSVFNSFENKFKGMWNVGVMVSIPVWHWGEGIYKVKAAKSEARISRYQLDDAKEKIELQVSQSVFKVNEAAKKLIMAEKNLEKADENLRYATLGFEEGVIPASNVLEAHTAWLSAQSEKIDAQIDVKLTEIYLKKATGSLNIEN